MTREYILTAVFFAGRDGWVVACAEEIPGAVAQGRTIEEARENLRDAAAMLLDLNRREVRESCSGHRVLTFERLSVPIEP